jgi:hypothetical protein
MQSFDYTLLAPVDNAPGRPSVRDIEIIDGELRLLARAWRVARELCDRMPSTAHIDKLLDERAAALSPLGGTEIFLEERACATRAGAAS